MCGHRHRQACPKETRLGYAGGLGPGSMDRAKAFADRYPGTRMWMDMEGRVRTGGRFDLAKIRGGLCEDLSCAFSRSENGASVLIFGFRDFIQEKSIERFYCMNIPLTMHKVRDQGAAEGVRRAAVDAIPAGSVCRH